MGDPVRYEVAEGVARVTIDRPAQRNALSAAVLAGLVEATARARADPDVHVLVLTGAGERAFCAGADLDELLADKGATGAAAADGPGQLGRLFLDLWSLGKPTIARVRGYALGGGFGLALACDLVVAAQDARFGTPELDVGLWPFVVTVPLTRSMPPKTALELMLTGRRVTAEEGQRIGFVHRVVGADHLDASVHELAATLVSKPPGVLRLGRDSFYAEWDRSTEEALGRLHQLLRLAARSPEATEGLRAFKEHRRPSWPPPG